jgi:hypothetical protein
MSKHTAYCILPLVFHVALASSGRYVAGHPEVELLLAALSESGVVAVTKAWDDKRVQWHDFDLVVVRACWDYHKRHVDFLKWAKALPQLANPYAILRWNIDKRYLRDLEANSMPIIPTIWDVSSVIDLPKFGDWVVKPVISAGSDDVFHVTSRSRLTHKVNLLAARGCTPIVQQYVREIELFGELSLIYIGGDRSHSVIRSVRPGYFSSGPSVSASFGLSCPLPYPYSKAWLFGDSVLHAACSLSGIHNNPLYGRVDLVARGKQDLMILEVEMIEPSLFLNHSREAPGRLASSIVSYLKRGVSHQLRFPGQ